MAVVISCVNLKGGVGKTALAMSLATFFGMQGKRTLLIDLDPQTNATFSCITVEEWEERSKTHGTVAHLLGARRHTTAEAKEPEPADILNTKVFQNVDLIPSHLDLYTVDLDLAGSTAREFRLKRAILPLLDNYDVVICDCPPNLTLPTQSGLAFTTHYVVPVSPDFLSAIGVALLLSRIKQLGADLGADLTLAGIVISRIGRPARHREETIESIRQQFGDDVLENTIREIVDVSKAMSERKPIYEYPGKACDDFTAVCNELSARIGAL